MKTKRHVYARTVKTKGGEDKLRYEVSVGIPERVQACFGGKKYLTRRVDAFSLEEAQIKAEPIIDEFKDAIAEALGPADRKVSFVIHGKLDAYERRLLEKSVAAILKGFGYVEGSFRISNSFANED